MEECRCCKNHYKQLVRHISLVKKCKEFYGAELDELKEQNKKKTNAKTKTIKEYFQKDSVGDIVISIFCDTHS